MKKLNEPRDAIMARLRAKVALGQPIIGAGAGVGLSAKAAEMGGIDLLVVYNSGRYRMAGRGSLAGFMPYGDANAIVMEMAGEVLTVVEKTPVLAGVCGTDPFRRMDVFLRQIEEIGFAGVQNFPTVGQFDGNFRENLEATGMPYAMEVEMIRLAHVQGLLTTPYCFQDSEAEQMADAGADIIVAHMGLTTKGSIGAASALGLDEAVVRVQRIADAAHATRPNVLVLCHGGPIAEPEDAAFVFERTRNIAGFYGASSIERLPAERAIRDQTLLFKSLKLSV